MSPSKLSIGRGGTGASFYDGEFTSSKTPAKVRFQEPFTGKAAAGSRDSFFDGTFAECDPGEDPEEEEAAEALQAIVRGRIVRRAKQMAEEEDALEAQEARELRGIVVESTDEEEDDEEPGKIAVGTMLAPLAAANGAMDAITAVAGGAGGWLSSFMGDATTATSDDTTAL